MKIEDKNRGSGAIIAIVLIVLVLGIAAYVMWGGGAEEKNLPVDTDVNSAAVNNAVADDLSADLDAAIQVDSTADLNAIEAEFR